MGETVVTADKLTIHQKLPQDVSVVSREEIVKRNHSNVEDVLKTCRV
jgi:iron complex outermembrane receptor protein